MRTIKSWGSTYGPVWAPKACFRTCMPPVMNTCLNTYRVQVKNENVSPFYTGRLKMTLLWNITMIKRQHFVFISVSKCNALQKNLRTLKMTTFHTKICQYATVTTQILWYTFFAFQMKVKLIVPLFIPKYSHDWLLCRILLIKKADTNMWKLCTHWSFHNLCYMESFVLSLRRHKIWIFQW